MGQLKDYFENNKSFFDDQELPVNHEKRFKQKMGYNESGKGLKIWYGVAAGFIMLSMFSFFAKDLIFSKKIINSNSAIISLSDISSRYQEVEQFYQAGVDAKIVEFKRLECQVDMEQQSMIDQELKEFDENYMNLQAELKRNMNDERIINAMITNYQTKLRFLELVIEQIKQNC